MNCSVISTSPRKNSNSLRVAKAIEAQLKKNHSIQKLLSFEAYDIPMVGQGSLDKAQLSSFQKDWIHSLDKAGLILMTVPEYNWITSGQLINAVHQTASPDFQHVFQNKVFAFAGVSSGRGGRLPSIEMQTLTNKVISFTNSYSIVSPKIFESHETDKNLDENGKSLGNSLYDRTLEDFVNYSIRIAEQWFG